MQSAELDQLVDQQRRSADQYMSIEVERARIIPVVFKYCGGDDCGDSGLQHLQLVTQTPQLPTSYITTKPAKKGKLRDCTLLARCYGC